MSHLGTAGEEGPFPPMEGAFDAYGPIDPPPAECGVCGRPWESTLDIVGCLLEHD